MQTTCDQAHLPFAMMYRRALSGGQAISALQSEQEGQTPGGEIHQRLISEVQFF